MNRFTAIFQSWVRPRMFSSTATSTSILVEPKLSVFVKPEKSVPPPRNPYDTVPSFLKVIGRGCGDHASKFSTWEELFTSNSTALKNKGINVRERKWILRWVQKYRIGIDPYYIKPPAKSLKKGMWKR